MPSFTHASPFTDNQIATKEDLQNFLVGLLDALTSHTSPGGALIRLGHTGTHFDEIAAQLEGFSRPIWGLASLLAGGGSYPGTKRWIDGYANGTDPSHQEFWGDMRNRDQRMVECAAIGYSIAVAKEQLWDPLPPQAKENFENWLGGMNDKQMPNTNWLWFRVFANLGLSRAGSPRFDKARMIADLKHLDTFYVGGGWSRDGPEQVVQFDYYSSSFAIQFAQLVYSKVARDEDPERCEEYRERARKFALDFMHYFDDEGRAIPFGRSMIYRFAQSSFWGALAFADVEPPSPLTWGVVKGLQLRNIRYWAKQAGAYNQDGTLTLGFNYPNLNLTENYNSPGSVYWCCKSFISLALPSTHPFWTAEEAPISSVIGDNTKILTYPFHIASHLRGHTFVLSSGQQCSYDLKQSAAKYGKYAYSSAFGYSVPVGNGTLEEAGGDSALALSDDGGEYWKCRRKTRDARFEDGVLRSIWYPWPDVEVETWLVPPQTETPLWHLRVHRIRTGREIKAADGGFAIYGQGKDERALEVSDGENFGIHQSDEACRVASRAGVSGIIALESSSQRKGMVIRLDANSNIVESRAALPTLVSDYTPSNGDIWVITAVFALPSAEGKEGAFGWTKEWEKRPSIPRSIVALMS